MLASLADVYDDEGRRLSALEKQQIVSKYIKDNNIDTMSREELFHFVNQLREEAKQKGMTFLDENGNPAPCC
jgi:hypothetical protein